MSLHYVMSRLDSVLFKHQNPDLRLWGQHKVVQQAAGAAADAGLDGFHIYDADESVCAVGFSASSTNSNN